MAAGQITDDYYAILEVAQTAEKATIRTSYRRLARLRHPDKNLNDPRATARFQLLQCAYNVLIDEQERRKYDLLYPSIRFEHRATNGNGGSSSFGGHTGSESTAFHTGFDTKPRPEDEEVQRAKKRIEELDKTLQDLYEKRRGLESEIFETQRRRQEAEEAGRRAWEQAQKRQGEQEARRVWEEQERKAEEERRREQEARSVREEQERKAQEERWQQEKLRQEEERIASFLASCGIGTSPPGTSPKTSQTLFGIPSFSNGTSPRTYQPMFGTASFGNGTPPHTSQPSFGTSLGNGTSPQTSQPLFGTASFSNGASLPTSQPMFGPPSFGNQPSQPLFGTPSFGNGTSPQTSKPLFGTHLFGNGASPQRSQPSYDGPMRFGISLTDWQGGQPLWRRHNFA